MTQEFAKSDNHTAISSPTTVSDSSTIDLTLAGGNLSAAIINGSITNTHINASAAIAYSKLALSNSIVNADINSSAAIAYSKLSLVGSILNADISGSAAIALNKLAALTASKAVVTDASGFLTTSATSSTEIGYVTGVTSAIQTQLNSALGLTLQSAYNNAPTANPDITVQEKQNFSVTVANNTSNSATAGAIVLTSGSNPSGNQSGGAINLNTGDSDTGSAGRINLNGGAGLGAGGIGGAIFMATGGGSLAGSVTISCGTSTANTGSGGNLTLTAGASASASGGNGGDVTVRPGRNASDVSARDGNLTFGTSSDGGGTASNTYFINQVNFYKNNIILSSQIANKGTLQLASLTAARTYTLPDATGTLDVIDATQTLSNKKFTDSNCTFADNSDLTKQLAFQCSGITTSTTRTLTVPDADGTITLRQLPDSATQAFGDASDATIQYNGTNMLVNPAAVGSGECRIGGTTDYCAIQADGDLKFAGAAQYKVANNTAAFVADSANSAGLFFSTTGGGSYEFRDASGVRCASIIIDSAAIFDFGIATPATSPAQITSNQNNYSIGQSAWARLNSDAARDITGIVAPADGQDGKQVLITNVGTQNITLKHLNASSTATNRIIGIGAADVVMAGGENARLIYDGTTLRWRVTSKQ